MRTNHWEKRLAEQFNRVEERTKAAVSFGSSADDKRRELTRRFLDDLESPLKTSIDMFNELSAIKIEYIKRAKDQRGNEYCGVKFIDRQILFTDTNRGFIRVDLVQGEAVDEVAFLLARLSRSGSFITWEEKSLFGVGNRLEPITLRHIVRKYITMLVSV
jgi:hypothetical protein